MAVIERFSYKNLIVYNHLQSNKLAVKHPEIAANSYGHYFSLNIWKGMVLGDSEIFKILDVFMENFLKIRIKCKLCGADVLNLQSCDCGRYHIKIDYMFNFLRESFFLNGNRIVVDHQEKLAKYYIDNDIVDLKYDENIDNKIKNYLVLI